MKKLLLGLLICLLANTVNGQNNESEIEHRHRIAPLLGYVFVPEETSNETGGSARLIPTFGVDYEYRIHPKFALGWFNDIELSSYLIEYEDEGEYLQREYAFISAICLVYSPFNRFAIFAGPGYEFEHHQNFRVFRVGVEYEILMPDDWDVAFGLSFDHKEVYNSFGITIAFGKRF